MTSPEPGGQLVCRSGALEGQTFSLGTETRIGRDPGNDIVIDARTISKHHAVIALRDDEYYLEDLDSSQGTLLDGRSVTEPARLDRMHVIELADVSFVFTRPTPSDRPAEHEPPGARGDELVEDEPVETGDEPSSPQPDIDAGPAEPASPSSPDESPSTPLGGDAEPPSDAETGGTVLDRTPFDALPELGAADAGATQIMTSFAPIPETVQKFEVVVELPDSEPTTHPLEEGENVVGRGEDCQIVIPDPERWLSRKHAALRVSGDGVELVDLGGANGTFLDGKRIEAAMLEPGTRFVLGPHVELTLQVRQ